MAAIVQPKDPHLLWSNIQKQFHDSSLFDSSSFRAKVLAEIESAAKSSCQELSSRLVELVTACGHPSESLGIILELKKSSSPKHANLKTSGPLLSRKLAEAWIHSDACAQAIVSFSLGSKNQDSQVLEKSQVSLGFNVFRAFVDCQLSSARQSAFIYQMQILGSIFTCLQSSYTTKGKQLAGIGFFAARSFPPTD